ncbi:ThiF family adenylyltransferase [Bradyrhizobium pachyrhizi]|uniref:ThiF family adenylyltransferase n=1 Tax=Bradyrhizobium pachyrhizi TaxID=280333 RepID=UPI00128EDE75|nr:ThiF family adenylyltransferase [Bradyrhizobium pachyrhizi]
MLIELANHNDDIRRLLEKGYALRVDGSYLVVRDIPYLDSQRALQVGAIVTILVPIDKYRMQQSNHEVYFAGSVPYGLDGKPIPNLGGGVVNVPLSKNDVVIERSFSNKPTNRNGFTDFFEKIESYVRIISGPAIELHGANPLTFRIDTDVVTDSPFKFQDSLTARAEIGDLAAVFKQEVVAVIGLGGTGAYLLDFLVKTPVKEIRGFDGDVYHVHNAYRSPGKLTEDELDKGKADVYQGRYDNFRNGLILRKKYIDKSSADDLAGVTFAFVCVDKGSARAEIFDLLISLGIPFIDVGMGLNRKQGPLSGTIRATYYGTDNAAEVKAMGLAEVVDDPDDIYRRNVQIAELNALNACIAMIRYKQLRGFYVDDNAAYHLLMNVANLRIFTESK